MPFVRSTVVAMLALLLAPLALAQFPNPVNNDTRTPVPGSGHDYINMLSETVDPSNGSLSVHISTPVPPGRGITIPFSFDYSSGAVQQAQVAGTTNGVTSAGWAVPNIVGGVVLTSGGWSYRVPELTAVQKQAICYVNGGGGRTLTTNVWADYIFTDPSGVRHNLGVANTETLNPDCSYVWNPAPSNVLSGGDDFYSATLSDTTGFTGGAVRVVGVDGTVYNFPATGWVGVFGVNAVLPSTIEDRNGNIVTISQGSGGNITETDTAGRLAVSISAPVAKNGTVSISGLSNAYTVTWETNTSNYGAQYQQIGEGLNDGCSWLAEGNGPSNIVIKSIELPNGTYYTFTYDSHGLLNQISYPTGAVVNYTWTTPSVNGLILFPDNLGNQTGCAYGYYAPMVAQRTVMFDGVHAALLQTFTYTTAYNAGVEQAIVHTTVYSSDGSTNRGTFKTVYNYVAAVLGYSGPDDQVSFLNLNIPVEQTVQYYDYGQTNLLETVTKGWQDQFRLGCQLETHDGSPLSGTFYSYGPGLSLTDKKEYDYGQISSTSECPQPPEGGPITAPAGATRSTAAAYQVFANATVADRPCQVITYDSTGTNRVAETDYYYDNGATTPPCGPAGTPSVTGAGGSTLTGHDETYYSINSTVQRGNVTQKTQWLNTGTSPVTTYTYDETGQVRSMTDPNLNQTSYSYADSFLNTNSSGFTTTAGSPPSGKVTNAYLTNVTYPTTNGYAHIESYSYGYNDGELTQSKDENRQQTTYKYNNSLGRQTETDYPDTGQTILSYNDTAPTPSVTTCQLINGTAGATCIATSPPAGWKTSLSTMDGLGHVVQTELVSDPDNPSYTATTYDGTGKSYQVYNPTRCSTPTTNCGTETTWGVSTYTYDGLGRTKQVAKPDGSMASTSYSTNQTTVTDEVGNQRISQADALGRLTAVWEAPNIAGYDYETQYQYDALNDLLSVTQNGSNSSNARVRTFIYDSLSRLTSATNPESGTNTYTYDANGNVATRVEPKVNTTNNAVTTSTYSYDALNRLLSKVHADPINANSFYGYDGTAISSCPGPVPPSITSPTNLVGRRSGMCTYRSASGWSYDPMGRPLLEARANIGPPIQTLKVSYAYYKDGSLNTLTYPSGDVVTYTVGGAGRATQLSDSSNNYVGYSGNTAKYAPHGSLASMTNGYTSTLAGIVTSNAYNDRLQPILLSASAPGGGLTTSISSITYTVNPPGTCSGTVVATVASTAGMSAGDAITITGDSLSPLESYINQMGTITGPNTINFGEYGGWYCSDTTGSGGTLTDTTATGPIFSLCFDFHSQTAISSGPCSFNAYTTGDNGNVYQILNNVDPTRSSAFIYDPLNRVAQAYTVNTNSANCWGETYSPTATAAGVLPSTPGIDAWGNLTNRSGVSGMSGSCQTEPLSATATTQNQLGGIGLLYDGAGNITTDNLGNTYTYDAENRIVTDAGVTYYYDSDGVRIEKSPGTMYWPGLGGETLTESTLAGVINEEYVYFNGERIARVDRPSGTVHYYFSNHLGSASVIATAATGGGVTTAQTDFYPFGGIAYSSGSDPNHYKFTGKERDTESGLDNFGARYNASSMGRFMSPDPSNLSVDFSLPQTWNRYAYALNNPLAVVDRNGLWPWYIHDEIIDESFPGMSKQDLQSLKDASWHMDMDEGQQDPANSYQHGMRDGTTNQDPLVAQQLGDDFISQQVQTAQQAQADWVAQGHTGIAPAALTAFGNALHTVTDRTSPSHKGNQPWYNDPWYNKRTRDHVWGEKTITAAQRAAARNAAQQLLHRIFGAQFDWMLLEQKHQKACVTWHDSATGESGGCQ